MSSRAEYEMPTSVMGWKSCWWLVSKYVRFSLEMMPTRLPSRNASSPTATDARSFRSDVDTPWLTKRHEWPYGSFVSNASPVLSVMSYCDLKDIPANAANS